MTDEWFGASYEGIAALQRTLALQSVDSAPWRGDESVLDLGCGDGAITAEIAKRVPAGSVLGIDRSADQIRFAREHHRLPNLSFATGDAIAFSAEPRDILTSFNALHWVHDLETATLRIHDAVRPGGSLLLRLVGAGERQSLEQTAAAVCMSPRWSGQFAGFKQPHEHRTARAWSQLLADAGFADVVVNTGDESWDFGSRDAFFSWGLGTFGPWLGGLPETEHAAFLTDVLVQYAQVAGREGLFRFIQLGITGQRSDH